jgi:plastocyanin
MTFKSMLPTLAAALVCASCGGSGGYGNQPTNPSPTPPANNNQSVVTITINGQKGTLSFSPNPATCATGQTVVWKNNDTVVHQVQIDELNINTGPIAPGASSAPMSLANVSKGYRCMIHADMVGALNGAATPNPTPCDPYGGC